MSLIVFACANFIYDLNGTKEPNRVGKDVGFITAFYKTDPVVAAPLPYTEDVSSAGVTYWEASILCKEQDSNLRLPNLEELMSMMYNFNLGTVSENYLYWAGTPYSAEKGWEVAPMIRETYAIDGTDNARCVWK